MRRIRHGGIVAGILVWLGTQALGGEEQPPRPRWRAAALGGLYFHEGDEPVDRGPAAALSLGYEWDERWTLEGVLLVAPRLKETFRTDQPTGARVSRLREAGGGDDTWNAGLALDGLYRFGPKSLLEPYGAAGVGFMAYGHGFDEPVKPVVRLGGGLVWRWRENLGIRADMRAVLAVTDDVQVHEWAGVGIEWRLGGPARTPPAGMQVLATRDRPRRTESVAGEEPSEAVQEMDSDLDGLTDPDEIHVYRTDPLNPDSDWDQLKDGEEVHRYRTNPLKRDTDGGGVSDGHEVLVDRTRPLDAADDLKLYELDINYAEGEWRVPPEYFPVLDAIAAELKSDPKAKVRIESHVDRTAGASGEAARDLTRRRSEAIREYFSVSCALANEMEAVGLGFTWPRAANDPEKGNPYNRRIEIYVRLSRR